MCGIVAFISRNGKTKTLWDIFRYAYLQRQRGDTDGFGIVYRQEGELKIYKSLLEIEDVYKEDKVLRKEDKRKVKEARKFLKETESDFVVLHHRWGTSGGISKKNTHPFVVKGEMYIHNGTIDSYTLERYFRIFHKYKQKTDLDSEFLIKFINEYGFGKAKKLWHGLGVLIRIDNGTLHIYKDYLRSLYLYSVDKKGGYIIISEPFPDKEFDWLYQIKHGRFTLSKGGLSGRYSGEYATKKVKEFLNMRRTYPEGRRIKSDCCKSVTLCFEDDKFHDICLNCFVEGVKIKDEYLRNRAINVNCGTASTVYYHH